MFSKERKMGVNAMRHRDIQELTRSLQSADPAQAQKQARELLRQMGYDPDAFYQELEMSFPLVESHRDVTYDPGAVMNLHSHNFYEVLYCCTDCAAEYMVGTHRYRLQKGDVILIPPGVSHRPLLPEKLEHPYKRYVLWMSQLFVSQFCRLSQSEGLGMDTNLLRPDPTHRERIEQLFRQGVAEAWERKTDWEMALVGNTVQLLAYLRRALANKAAVAPQAEKPILLDRVMGYIEAHLGEKITLAEVARYFFVSESTVTQLFHRKMGTSFYNCVTQRRLIAAKALIQKGEKLESVGQRVGFSDYSSFYRAFRKLFGISPRQYRKLQEHSEV